MGDPIALSGSGLGKKLHFVRTRATRPTHVARHPPQPQAPGFSSEELSSSGEGEENEQRAAGDVVGQTSEKGGKQVVEESRKGELHAIAESVRVENEEGRNDVRMSGKETGVAGNAVSETKAHDLLGSLIPMDSSPAGASMFPNEWRPRERDSAGRRRSAERIDVVDLLSGEALEPQSSELWSFEANAAPADKTDRSEAAGQHASTAPTDWPEESCHGSNTESSVAGTPVAGTPVENEDGEGNSEDEEQAGWRSRARRGSSAPAEAGPGRQPAAYWELLRRKGQASDSGGEQKHGGEARRSVRRRAPGDEAGAVVVSDGDTSPGTPGIVERR